MTGANLLRLQLLSDRHGRLGALRLRPLGLGADALTELGAPLADLVGKLPCLFDAGGAPETTAALLALGAREFAPDELASEQAAPAGPLPDSVHWLPGDWYLQAPSQPISSHAASRAQALKLMQLVAAEADTHEIEEVFRREPTLSYHLLRLVNSVAMGLNRKITSFSQAIILIGRQQLRRWLNFILFATRADDPRSAMLLARVATRARCMELLAKAAGWTRSEQDQAFMTGMFSLLGVLFGQPLAEVLTPLKLAPELQAALLQHEGRLGALYSAVEACERGDVGAAQQALAGLAVPITAFNRANIEAHDWMLAVLRDSEGS